MAEDREPRGIHRRMEAKERRLARLEADMLGLQAGYASASTGEDVAIRLGRAQEAYDATLRELRELQASSRRLRDWGLSAGDTASWASVGRALGVAAGGGAHRAVRRAEPVLHVLLHRSAFSARCSIDAAIYE